MGGPRAPGMFLEYSTVPLANCTRIPEGMIMRLPPSSSLVAVMMHMLELCEIRAGDTVAVTGAGPIGMLFAASPRPPEPDAFHRRPAELSAESSR